MELKTKIEALSDKFDSHKQQINTEEATKTAFILPFIAALGYDIFNPIEVVPEFIADVGLKKGEKVDYAIIHEGSPAIIFECKHWQEDLANHTSQLYRYFSVTNAKFGVLTNGHEYRFYTDLVSKNVMDQKPFLSFDIHNMRESVLVEISKFHKTNFDQDKISTNATSLKYINEIKNVFRSELVEPSDDFAKFFASRIVSGIMTRKVVSSFIELVPTAIKQIINEQVNERLHLAITKEAEQVEEPESTEDKKIETTEEELYGFRIIQAILCKVIDLKRVVYRDTQSYFGVLLDDNNRRPICRLHLNSKTKYIGVFDESKKEVKHKIKDVIEIYNYQDKLLNTLQFYNK